MKQFSQLLFLASISCTCSSVLRQVRRTSDATPQSSQTQVDSAQSRASLTKLQTLEPFHATAWDRYPSIFKGLKDLLQADGDRKLKLLSFGCSDGTECHALRKYFPNAVIDGVDIASDLIAKNKASNKDPGISFYDTMDSLSTGTYDAILAMGVLTEQVYYWVDKNFVDKGHLEHQRYVSAIDGLDALLRPGGYLVMYNADYPFTEYPHHSRYQNMCTRNVSDHAVTSADVKYDYLYGRREDHGLDPRGACTASDKFCIESGWVCKFNRVGDSVQSLGQMFGPGKNRTWVKMSNGCRHAGPFFKKLESAAVTNAPQMPGKTH